MTLDGGKQWFAKTKVEVGAAKVEITTALQPLVTKAEEWATKEGSKVQDKDGKDVDFSAKYWAEKLNLFLNGKQGSVDIDRSGYSAIERVKRSG